MFWSRRKQLMTSNEVRHGKNSRILTDIPWLWAVRSSWRLRHDEISIHYPSEVLRQFLYDPQPDPAIELWIYKGGFFASLWVERIDPRPQFYPLGVRIQDYVRSPFTVLALAVVKEIKHESNMDHVEVQIYRPQKGEESLLPFIKTAPTSIWNLCNNS